MLFPTDTNAGQNAEASEIEEGFVHYEPSTLTVATTSNSKSNGKGKQQRSSTAANSQQQTHFSQNRRWVAPALGAETASSVPSSPATSSVGSGYAHRPGFHADGSKICYDVSSYKFIPEDSKRITIVLKKVNGSKNCNNTDPGSQLRTVHNFSTIFSADVTGIPADQAPGPQAHWDNNQFRWCRCRSLPLTTLI